MPPILTAVHRGILGGTFDPPHLAHLVAGNVALHQLGLDVVSVVPAGAPWQKANRLVSAAEHRWQMVRLACEGVDGFEPDDREVRRDGWTYTIDTLEALPAEDRLVLILGADAARNLPSWQRAADVIDRAYIAVLPRPGMDPAEVESAIPGVIWLDAPALDISGTDLRHRVAAGSSIRFLVPDSVFEYIELHHLYRPNDDT